MSIKVSVSGSGVGISTSSGNSTSLIIPTYVTGPRGEQGPSGSQGPAGPAGGFLNPATESLDMNSFDIEGVADFTSSAVTTDYIRFNTTPVTSSEVAGTVHWNPDELTLDLHQNGTIIQVGQEVQYNVRNNTGQTILNGTPVMAVGTIGNSGRIVVAPSDASDIDFAKYFLGLATEDIPDGVDGKVTHFGKVRQIDTSAWGEGDVLWLDPDNTGSLVNVEPIAGKMGMPVAFVISSGNNGTLFVRTNNLNQHEFIRTKGLSIVSGSISMTGSLDVSGSTYVESLQIETGSIPTSVSSSGEPGMIRVDSNYIYVCVATDTWKRSLLSSW